MNRVVPRLTLVALSLFALNSTTLAEDSKAVIYSSVDIEFKNLSLGVGGNYNATLSTANPNIVYARGKAYVSLGYDAALGPGSTAFIESAAPQTLTMSRSDAKFTAGYRVLETVSVFGGWLYGNINALQSGARYAGSVDQYVVQDIVYNTTGPFLGASWSHPIGRKSSLSVSAAYARLAGSTSSTTTKLDLDGSGTMTVDSNTDSFGVQGYSASITWSGELVQSLGYRIGVKMTDYKGEPTASTPGGIKETYTSLFFGISNFF